MRSVLLSALSTILIVLAGQALAGAIPPQSTVGTPGISLKTAALVGGKLVISGTASSIGVVVRIRDTAFQAKANAQKTFRFDVLYRTPDCRVTLETSTGALTAMISACAPGVVPRGAWSASARYAAGDLVLDNGSTFRALRANVGKPPHASRLEWQTFAARGAVGLRGPQGAQGAQGAQGPAGPTGAKGDIGLTGPAGLKGDPGPAGLAGAKGEIGPAGPTGAKGEAGPAGPAGPRGSIGPAGPTGPKGEKGDPALLTGKSETDSHVRSWTSLGAGWLDLCRVQVTTLGKPVLVGGNISVDYPSAAFELQIYRDGARISSGLDDSNITYYDAPGAGAHTYALRLYAHGEITTRSCQIFALELNQAG